MRYKQHVEKQIGSVDVGLALGDMTATAADAYIVPQFEGGASEGGVGGAICRAGAERGVIDEYEQRVKAAGGKLEFGSAFVTPSHGGQSDKLIHVVSVGSGREKEFRTIQRSIYTALEAAHADGSIKNIVCPVLGTGIIGSLTEKQSAMAMMSAVHQFDRKHPDSGIKMSFVVYGDPARPENPGLQALKQVLESGEYREGAPVVGQREFDAQRFVDSMNADAAANTAAGVGSLAEPKVAAPKGSTVTLVTDTVVAGSGRTWVSDARAQKPSQDRMIFTHPDDAATVLEALDAHISGIYKPITYKISEIDIDGRKVIGIGSADPSFYMGIGESSLLGKLQQEGKTRTCLMGGARIEHPAFGAQIAKAAHMLYPEDQGMQALSRPDAPQVSYNLKRGFGS